MFTGIIESLGKVSHIEKEGTNLHFTIQSSISDELKIDQSIAHNGVCLTVVDVKNGIHVVTAIQETLDRTNLGKLKPGDEINLERAMLANARLDGHLVQGHVDKTGLCTGIESLEGSRYYTFEYESSPEHLLVDKGSICLNGVSLTVVNPSPSPRSPKGEVPPAKKEEKSSPPFRGLGGGDGSRVQFSVAIIPYTLEHTNFKDIKVGDTVNLEFDVIGKYISKYLEVYVPHKS